jgi:hypothetical protein
MSGSDGPTSDDRVGSDRRGSDTGRTDRGAEDPVGVQVTDWLAASTLRVALTVFGFVLVLFAIGQAVGLDLLGMVVEALDTDVGRWLVVAFVGLLIIAIAMRGFDSGTR